MASIRVHTIRGRYKYYYLHESRRVGGKPKKKLTYLGPVSGGVAVLQLAAKFRDKGVREQLKPIEERLAGQAARKALEREWKDIPQKIDGLSVSKNWNADIEATRETGIKSAPQGAEVNSPSSGSSAPPSQSEDESGEA